MGMLYVIGLIPKIFQYFIVSKRIKVYILQQKDPGPGRMAAPQLIRGRTMHVLCV